MAKYTPCSVSPKLSITEESIIYDSTDVALTSLFTQGSIQARKVAKHILLDLYL